MRDTYQSAVFREEDKTEAPVPEPGPPSPPVHPKLIEARRNLSRLSLPIDTEREARLWRRAVLDLAEAVYGDTEGNKR
jgi:hypothetical protein